MNEISAFISMLVIASVVSLVLMSFGRAITGSLYRAANAISGRLVEFIQR